jgi:hypothetical protein
MLVLVLVLLVLLVLRWQRRRRRLRWLLVHEGRRVEAKAARGPSSQARQHVGPGRRHGSLCVLLLGRARDSRRQGDGAGESRRRGDGRRQSLRGHQGGVLLARGAGADAGLRRGR